MSKTIDFHKTSNMAIEINEMCCSACHKTFYELEDHELDQCPMCDYMYGTHEPDKNDSDCDTYLLIVDPNTGIPSIIRRGKTPELAPKEGAEQ